MDLETDSEDPFTRSEITRILANVNSIRDFSRSIAEELVGTNGKWSDRNQDITGIEYDAQREYIIVKAANSPLHETAATVVEDWMAHVLAEELGNATGSSFEPVRTTSSFLGGDHIDSQKDPDAGLRQDDNLYPLVALEVAVSETTRKVF
ncbi:hypothetical protein AJ80_07486 [Polytolypa hystricis UAMH7299]|uniref:Uncharacterized protein n=1 Tax=Polytolypa hystricis (strain UAMH7299) TaxID=1447883 RepID=A0A2B7XNN8_POLH7|nr:hypothetical protein AJ80_07486 [Polytolypa hystricis UAMH7299]